MKLLTFQARRFAWRSFEKNLPEATDEEVDQEVGPSVVVFLHAESRDEAGAERARVFRHTLKHIKWLANKRDLKSVVLHSFTHLGAENAGPAFARDFMGELAQRLTSTGYAVQCTPFGWFCEWDLSVGGESLAKVWKEI